MAVKPESKQATTPAEPALSPTQVRVNGKVFELEHMDVKAGLELYAAVKADPNISAAAKQQIDQIATMITMVQSIKQVELPPGIDPSTALSKYIAAMQKGKGQLLAGAEAWMKPFGEAVDPVLRVMPGYEEAIGLKKSTDAATSIAKGFTIPIWWAIGLPFRVVDAAGTVIGEGNRTARSAAGGYSEDQAKAFAAAYVAVQEQKPEDAPKQQASGILPNLGSAMSASLDYAYLKNPWGITQWVMAACQWAWGVFNYYVNSEPWPDWKKLNADLQNDISSRRGVENTSWRGLFEAQVAASTAEDKSSVVDRLAAAKDIAGIPTSELPQLVAKGGVYYANDTTAHVVGPNGKGDTPIKDPKTDKPVTAGDRTTSALASVVVTDGLREAVNDKENWPYYTVGGYLGTKHVVAPVVKTIAGKAPSLWGAITRTFTGLMDFGPKAAGVLPVVGKVAGKAYVPLNVALNVGATAATIADEKSTTRDVVTSAAPLGFMGLFAFGGAVVGGTPTAGVGAVPGAVIGAGTGGLIDLGLWAFGYDSKVLAGEAYDYFNGKPKPKPATAPKKSPAKAAAAPIEVSPEVAAQAQAAAATKGNKGKPSTFACVSSTAIGNLPPGDGPKCKPAGTIDPKAYGGGEDFSRASFS